MLDKHLRDTRCSSYEKQTYEGFKGVCGRSQLVFTWQKKNLFGLLSSDVMPWSVVFLFSCLMGSNGFRHSLHRFWNNIKMCVLGSVLNPESKPA